MALDESRTCCFTGHRPDKLPWGLDERDSRCAALKHSLARELDALYRRGFRHFIAGMALGCDFYFAEAVLVLRERQPDVTLEGAVPCPTQAQRWPEHLQHRWRGILDQCDLETVVQQNYDRWCMLRRDRYMVEMAAKYPEYRFDRHKGYGTKLHYELLRTYGPSPIHRRTFLKRAGLPPEER